VTFLDNDRELDSISHGQHWTPDAGQSSTPVDIPDANWIQTNPEKGFFTYFRWYSPTKTFFDRSWKMGNIVEVK